MGITENATCILNLGKCLFSFKMKVLFLFMITSGAAISFYLVIQVLFIGKGNKALKLLQLHHRICC